MIHKAHKIWENKEIINALLIDLKRAFNYVSQVKLMQHMRYLNIDNNLID